MEPFPANDGAPEARRDRTALTATSMVVASLLVTAFGNMTIGAAELLFARIVAGVMLAGLAALCWVRPSVAVPVAGWIAATMLGLDIGGGPPVVGSVFMPMLTIAGAVWFARSTG